MSYRIAQDEKYLGHERWQWSAWIEASQQELDQLDAVVWILHPTFNPSRIEVRSCETQFRLKTSGWGTFTLRAELRRKDGEVLNLSHKLKLTYPDDEDPTRESVPRSTAPRKGSTPDAPIIFLSYSSEDKLQAQDIRSRIERLGARVLDASTISPSLPMEAAIRKMIRESDAVMSIVGSDYFSPSVLTEIKVAQAEDKPTVAVLPEHVSLPSGMSSEVPSLRFGKGADAVDPILAAFVGKLTG